MWHEIKESGIDSEEVLFTELRQDKQVTNFIKMRLELLLRAYKLPSNSVELTQNEIFIRRLINSEMNLIKMLIDFLPTN